MSRRRSPLALPAVALALAVLGLFAPAARAQVVPGPAPVARDTVHRRLPVPSAETETRRVEPAVPAASAPASASTPAAAVPPTSTARAVSPFPPLQDSLRVPPLFGDTSRLWLGLEPMAPLWPRPLPPAPGRNALWLRPRLEDWTAAWAAAARSHAAARTGSLAWAPPLPPPVLASAHGPGGVGHDTVATKAAPTDDCCKGFLPPAARRDTLHRPALLPGAMGEYADLGMKVQGRGELGTAWTRYYPCDPSLPALCNPSAFPQLKPDIQFGVQVGGTVSDRVHVNVDYDQRREFDAANNINVYYQGYEDEVLQKLEVGDVSIRLPQSRYLTQGIPAGNFGFKATGQLGPMDFQAVWAQQKGDVSKREFKLNGGAGAQAGLVQDANVTLDDAAYVKGQFFFIMNPDSLRGAPHVNALQLRVDDAPAGQRPLPGTLVVYRDERISPSNQAQVGQLGYFMANAVAHPGLRDSVAHTGYFRRLQPGTDYMVHASGLWLALRSPLRQDEALAIGYVDERGDTIGSINADAQRTGTPTLRLIRGPLSVHNPGSPTWPLEMHQIYRVDASNGVDATTVALTISLGQLSGGKTFTAVAGKQLTYLKLMGLDELPPADVLDGVQIWQPSPSSSLLGGTATTTTTASVGGTFVVFPTLRPFEVPPPVPSANLTAADAASALGSDANRDIYENPDPVARDAAGRFRLNLTYRVKVDGMISTLNLGALGIREGSEKIFVGDKQLESGKDYTIDYDIGAVTLLDPQSAFGGNPSADIRATWEQKAAFQLAPTSIFGLNTHYKLGGRGDLNFIGLYQAEKTLMNRPELGTEPSSIFLGGVSGKMDLGGGALDAVLSRVPGLRYTGKASVSVSGEAAMSSPNPNTRGATYLDDFEAGDETPIALNRQSWHLGSRPTDPSGDQGVLPSVLDVRSAMKLVWQHDYIDPKSGQVGGSLDPRSIDKSFNVGNAGLTSTTGEQVLWLSMGGDTLPQSFGHDAPQRRWRSITTVLSPTGRDMSRSEYLEFYVQVPKPNGTPDRSAALVFDIGTIGNDAFYYDANGQTSGQYPDGTPWGLGTLDQEADPARHQIWGTASDSLGLWNQPCHADRGASYGLGDARSNCTRGNGLVDTEDLAGSGVLSGDGAYFRYVVKVGDISPYLVRDETGTGTTFRLYRIPLRSVGVTAVGGANDGTWRYIQDLRLTLVDSAGASPVTGMGIARLRIIGSRWAKRDVAGLEQGLTNTTPLAADTSAFQVGPVSGLTDATYASPPGITSEIQDPTTQFAAGAAQIINEKSMRLAVDHLGPNTRAEAYYRYPQQPRSFLNYRQMRLWAVARKGSWGKTGDQRLVIKVGNDPDNYYFYQSRLNPAQAAFAAAQWLPEITIDFNQWFTLRAQAEQMMAATTVRDTAPFVMWSRDSSYGIVLQDRARAPNLAAVRELSFAIYNGGLGTEATEVWIDDLRLSAAMTDPGFAGNVQVDIHAGDFLNATATVANQGALFHQLSQDASYQRTAESSVNGNVQLGLIAPGTWDLDAPLTFSWGHTALAPQFLAGTDIPANLLTNLRGSGSNRTRVAFSLRRRTPVANPWLGLVMDGLALRFGYTGSSDGSASSLARSSGVDGALTYDRRPSAHEFGVMPSFLQDALKAVFPRRMEQSEFFKRLTGARLRWTPDALSFSTSYYNQKSDAFRYDQILRLPTDSLPPITSARLGLDNDARLSLRPFESLTAALSLGSTRDLLPPGRASTDLRVQDAIQGARGAIGGLGIGWEASRSVSSQLDWRPVLASWLRPGFSFSGTFRANRNPSFLQAFPLGGDSLATDTTWIMQRAFQADRQVTRSLQLDPNGLLGALAGGKPGKRVSALAKAFQPLELTWTSAQGSQFDRMNQGAGTAYQLGLGGLGAWRYLSGDTATLANTRNGFRGRSTITLPFGTEIATSYDDSRTQLFDLRGGQRTDDARTWPSLQLTWSQLPLPRGLKSLVTQATISGGYQHTLRTSDFGALAAPSQGGDVGSGGSVGAGTFTSSIGHGAGEDTSIPVQLALGLVGTLNASYNGSITSGTASDPTGDARKNGSNHTVTLSGFFKAPVSWRDRFPNPVQATIGLSSQADHQCRLQTGVDGAALCTPFIDYTMRRINVSLDTELSQVTVGFQMSYNARKSNIGTLNGSSQFQLGIFGQFNLNVGQLQGAGRGPQLPGGGR